MTLSQKSAVSNIPQAGQLNRLKQLTGQNISYI
jgi:hypothetical protein